MSVIQQEMEQEVNRLTRLFTESRQPVESCDLERMEGQVREWALRVGSRVFERILENVGEAWKPERVECPECKGRMTSQGIRKTQVHCTMGTVDYERRYYYCKGCSIGKSPLDEHLGLDERRNTPGLCRIVSLAGSEVAFESASNLLREIGGLEIDTMKVQRLTEDVGREMERWLQERRSRGVVGLEKPSPGVSPRLYVSVDGAMAPIRSERPREKGSRKRGRFPGAVEYREVKAGAVYDVLESAGGELEVGTTTYTATLEEASVCVDQVKAEALARGGREVEEIVVLADGAEWIWNRVPGAFAEKRVTEILDFYHASERLADMGRKVHGEGTEKARQWSRQQRERLLDGEIEPVIQAMRSLRPKGKDTQTFVRQSIGYFETNRHRMTYDVFRENGYYIGSGVIESACKQIVGTRLKGPGMQWALDNTPAMLALRVCHAGQWWGRFWDSRAGRAA